MEISFTYVFTLSLIHIWYGYPYCRGRVLHVVEKDTGQYDTPADLLWATGACLFVQTAVYKEVGGLDAGFFAHQEEIDMCWRLRSRGYRLVCTPSSVVYHVGGDVYKRQLLYKYRLILFLGVFSNSVGYNCRADTAS